MALFDRLRGKVGGGKVLETVGGIIVVKRPLLGRILAGAGRIVQAATAKGGEATIPAEVSPITGEIIAPAQTVVIPKGFLRSRTVIVALVGAAVGIADIYNVRFGIEAKDILVLIEEGSSIIEIGAFVLAAVFRTKATTLTRG